MYILLKQHKKNYQNGARKLIDQELSEDLIGFKTYSFRKFKQTTEPNKKISFYPYTQLGDEKDKKIALLYFDQDTIYASVLYWKLLHKLPIHGVVAITAAPKMANVFNKGYYSNSFELIGENRSKSIFFYKKTKSLLIEQDKGLDRWSFGIPVGPEDATLLNKVVERILELGIKTKEIILCGTPGKNFKYFDKVRIVGTDIPAPPVRISRKKNKIAEEALYENLCIIHDRVLLPLNFYKAMQSYGDSYPLLGFNSLHFRDYMNLLPIRYSDLGFCENPVLLEFSQNLDHSKPTGHLDKNLFPLYDESVNFFYANPLLYNENTYLTGSLFICKKSLWNKYPHNKNLHWAEYEDVEFCLRHSRLGIPSLLNPYAFTQSLSMRSLLTSFYATNCIGLGGRDKLVKLCLPVYGILDEKPLLKLSNSQYKHKVYQFIEKYVRDFNVQNILLNSNSKRKMGFLFLKFVFILGNKSSLKKNYYALKEYIDDFEKLVFCEQLSHSFKQAFIVRVRNGENIGDVLAYSPEIMNKSIYSDGFGACSTLDDFLVKDTIWLRLGSFISAILLYASRKSSGVYIKGGILSYYRAILNSTPWK